MKKIRNALLAAVLGLVSSSSPSLAEDIPFFAQYPAIDKSIWYFSNGWSNGPHQSCEWNASYVFGDNNHLKLILDDKPGKTRAYSCGEIQTYKTYSYGRYESRMKASKGSGMNSAFFTYIGPPNGAALQDEIDFEFLGKDEQLVQVGYWHDGKNYDVKVVDLGFDASAAYHDYVFEWYPDHVVWFVDGKQIHETSGDYPIPALPGKIFFSLWSGGKPVDDWLGHFTYESQREFDVEWVKFTPFQK
jgi:endo-1,3-1,4-beta-glycanase ExoK